MNQLLYGDWSKGKDVSELSARKEDMDKQIRKWRTESGGNCWMKILGDLDRY